MQQVKEFYLNQPLIINHFGDNIGIEYKDKYVLFDAESLVKFISKNRKPKLKIAINVYC